MSGGSVEVESFGKLPEKQVRFLMEYLVDYNGKAAALRAGYTEASAGQMAHKILAKTPVKRFLAKFEKESQEAFEIDRYEILRHLAAVATRNAKWLVDDDGVLLLAGQNINDLPDEVTIAVEGIKQKVKKYYDDRGEVSYEILTTEIKLASKTEAIAMCMKHKGLFAPEQHDVRLAPSVDWAAIKAEKQKTIDVDPVKQRLLEEERKR